MRKILCTLLLMMSFLTLCSCTESKVEYNHFDAEYTLLTATLDGVDITDEFSAFTVTFKSDGTMRVFYNRTSIITTRNSTYTYDGVTIINEKYNNQTFIYTKLDNYLISQYDDFGDLIEVVLQLKVLDDAKKSVAFESQLFGSNIADEKIYNYCPAIIMDKDEDGNNRMNIWYCTNKDSGIIVDYIGFRQGIEQKDGTWLFSDEKIVLEPTENTWDARHTCDPTVVKGEFKLKGETYNYLMAYLGCTTEDYQKNETGIAVAKNIEGPWVKIDAVNPIVPWYDDGDIQTEEAKYQNMQGTTSIYWGTGMPSLLSIDGKGEVILLYQSTLRGTGIRRIDLSDLENPIEKYTVSIKHTGLLNSQYSRCNVGIPDFAYDSVNKRLYMVGVTNERNPADITKTLVNSHSVVAYIENLADMEAVSTALQSGNYQWNVVGHVGPAQTGWERNHNPGMVKGEYSDIVDPNKIQVVVSTGKNSWPNENIFTYRLFGWTFNLK